MESSVCSSTERSPTERLKGGRGGSGGRVGKERSMGTSETMANRIVLRGTVASNERRKGKGNGFVGGLSR